MKLRTSVTFAVGTVCVLGCAGKPDENRINAQIENYWKPCAFVKPTPIKVIRAENNRVRFTYNVVVLKNGSDVKPNECPAENSSMLEALANEDLAKFKLNTVVEVTMEQGY